MLQLQSKDLLREFWNTGRISRTILLIYLDIPSLFVIYNQAAFHYMVKTRIKKHFTMVMENHLK